MSSFTVQCWGCGYSETHPWNGPGKEYDASMEDLKARGWRRRAFWPDNWDKGPWFCSEDCAYNSYNAKRAEEYWNEKTFQEYCQKTAIPFVFLGPLLFAVIAIATMALGDCLHAGL